MKTMENRKRGSSGQHKGAAMKSGWQTKNLGDICDVIGGGTPPKDNPSFYSGDIPWATVRDMRQDVITETEFRITKEAVIGSSTNIIPSGNVVIATRVGLGKVCLLSQDTAINQDLRGIVPRNDQALIVRYLYWWLKSIADVIVAEGTGATVQGVKLPFVKSLQIPVPPLPEQHRIVEILDKAFADIAKAKANAERNLQNARELFESQLNEIFQLDYRQYDIIALSELVSDVTDGDHQPPPKSLDGIPFITIGNIIKDTRQVDFSSTFKVPRSYFASLKTNRRPQRGDVLYTVTGSFGIPVLIDSDCEFCFQRHIGLIRPKTDTDSRWICYLLLSPQVYSQAAMAATGTAQKTVSLRSLRSLRVPRLPIARQQQQADQLDVLSIETQRLARIYQRKLEELEALKRSILKRVFSGEL